MSLCCLAQCIQADKVSLRQTFLGDRNILDGGKMVGKGEGGDQEVEAKPFWEG
jgi:hypothetical protein